jgi:hypothetical protein
MAKPLRVILESKEEGKDTKLKGVKKSTVRSGAPTDEYPGMGPKEQDGKDFVAKHKVEVHADRVGNGDEDYKGKTKQAKYKKQSDDVYEEKSCGGMEPHQKKKGKKLLLGGKKTIEERHMTSAEKSKEKRIKKKVDPSGMKASMKKQYGDEKGKKVYFATIRKQAMESVLEKRKKKIKETTGPDTPMKTPSGKVGDNANSPGFNV